ncbi:pyruvate dehydrogenase (acetyl-transferring) E1 component subunit alpha [bacterium NHP-B]|nr:pyruvate dehydrogenase (acetyl-transferring) E1 component subunit alpha [Candidatus Hepatobacter penaei]TGW14669.1 pyruvate dehydrogenase (acetyl-transferring) E1 component subunit alpha [bacterium NHP-B]
MRSPLKEAILRSEKTRLSSARAQNAPSLDILHRLYQKMLLIRRFEERAGQLYGQGSIGGFCHLYIGQEAIAVGTYEAKEAQDTMVTAYRDHGHMLVSGMDPRFVMAELTGKAAGSSQGKGGSMHMFDPEKGFLGGHGIVGAQVPLGTGVAFAHQYLNKDAVSLVFLGDGAANQGQVYEAFNMASLWRLPVLYIIENNRYAMGTSVERACANSEDLYRRGEPWGIPGQKVNGMDVLEVIEATRSALAQVRTGQPMLLEMTTYRYRGHSMSDPALYRTKEEVDNVKTNEDPLLFLKELILTQGQGEEEPLKTIEKEVKEIVLDAVAFAKEAPLPDDAALYTDVIKEEA